MLQLDILDLSSELSQFISEEVTGPSIKTQHDDRNSGWAKKIIMIIGKVLQKSFPVWNLV